MDPRPWIRRVWWRVLFLEAKGDTVQGVEVRILLPDVPREELMSKLTAALNLVALYAPRSLRLLRRCRGILVFGQEGPSGEWHRDARLITLSERHVSAEGTRPEHIAATIVHEGAHAWLEDRGIRYTAERRRRIESVCVRAEARFAERIPGGQALATFYNGVSDRILGGSDEEWSNAAFRKRDIARLLALDTPIWFLRLLGVRNDELPAPSTRDGADTHDV